MQLGTVIGNVWATKKLDSFDGKKLLVVQPIDGNRKPVSVPLIAVDTVDAGQGDTVFYATSREATIPFIEPLIPVDAAIVGVVDRIDR
ncbi:MAG: EutN/CcmL family microcompartment protein [Marinilabiliales bacterium]|nr:EutN/CcmL family microcompartment protein [Marinilabiliales bacterium]